MLVKDVNAAEEVELAFWRDSPTERPGSNSIDNLLNKASEARVFMEKLRRFAEDFGRARRILELGAGQAWASCLVKRFYPAAEVVATDLSPAALAGLANWPPIFGGQPLAASRRAYSVPFADSSFDLAFAFAAAHHFRRHRSALREVARVLRPGGKALFLHEPTCHEYIYPFAYRRVNRKRPEVPEDVLVRARIRRLAAECGLAASVHLAPTGTDRDPVPGAYYLMLRKIPVLQKMLPCTADFELQKAR
ncbi:MAG: class I SAM-dependent methyltransferase [Terriglobales bacterium]